MKMPFGKYQDVEIARVPRPYLLWLRRQPWLSKWLVKAIDEVFSDDEKHRQSDHEKRSACTSRLGTSERRGLFVAPKLPE